MDNEKSVGRKRLIIYIVVCFVLSWGLILIMCVSGIPYGAGTSLLFLTGLMFMPALSSVLTRLFTKEGFKNMYLHPNFKHNIKTYLLIYFGPTLLILFSMVPYFLIFPSQFDANLSALKYLSQQSGASLLTPQTTFLIMALQLMIIGPIINIIPTLGEELGWRGYLIYKLRLFFSDRAALLLTGIIWGLWHAPIIAMGHNYGTHYFGYPVLGILAMILFCVSLGIIEGYFSLKLKSCIPAAMIHSAVNAGAGLPMVFIKGSYNPLFGPSIVGLIGGLLLVAVAIILYFKSDGTRKIADI